MKRFLKVLRNILIVFVGFAVALTGFTKFIHYPNPIAAIRLGLAPASKTPTLMPWNTIAPANKPIAWPTSTEAMPATVPWENGSITWQEFLKKTYTNAFLVIRNGVITYEYYGKGFTEKSIFPSYSEGKTMTSIVIGQLIHHRRAKGA